VQVYVLDARHQPVPVGVAGEIYIGGVGLARGYLRLPSLTAERFTPHPFADEPGARLYRTGDLAKRLPDGRLSFLGRCDHQVKVRGFRIETGEVEAALLRHEQVREAAVLAREDGPAGGSLVAYIVAEAGRAPSPAELRASLRERLPEYMLPAAFVVLEEMPLTPNGKLDRKALPAPGEVRSESATEFVPPRTAVEREMACIWSELLRVERVGVHDNFFDLGGHSLLATRLVSRIEQALAVRLPLRTVFELPTLDQMTKAVVAARVAEEDPAKIALMFKALEGLSQEEITLMLNAED
jgi:acyl carrier protein